MHCRSRALIPPIKKVKQLLLSLLAPVLVFSTIDGTFSLTDGATEDFGLVVTVTSVLRVSGISIWKYPPIPRPRSPLTQCPRIWFNLRACWTTLDLVTKVMSLPKTCTTLLCQGAEICRRSCDGFAALERSCRLSTTRVLVRSNNVIPNLGPELICVFYCFLFFSQKVRNIVNVCLKATTIHHDSSSNTNTI